VSIDKRGAMQVGLFDHLENSGRPLASLYDERLQFVVAAEEAGFYCLHVAEHHASPISMVPVPGVYLGAVARATKKIHLGPLVYLLTLYSPLRMIEEISMLDHLSHGRLEIGVGRGVSPFELSYHKVDHDESRDIFIDAYKCVTAGLTNETLSYAGKYFTYKDVPMAMRPMQLPMPPFWYGSSNTIGATWAGEHGMHFTANGPTSRAKVNIDAFREALDKRGGAASPKAEFSGGTAIGVLRQIVVADSDAEAVRIAKPAAEYHLGSLNWLRAKHGFTDHADRLRTPGAATFDDLVREGIVIAGSPDTVVREIERQTAALGINYLLTYLFFGTMTLADALGSLTLFRTEVMPRIARL